MTWNMRSSEFTMYQIPYIMNLLNKYIIIFLYLGKFVGHALHDLYALTAGHCHGHMSPTFLITNLIK